MTILVTGANGQLGEELQHLPASDKANYIFTDVAELDIARLHDIENFVEEHKVDVIINCAAYTDVEGAERDVERAEEINVEAVANLAEVAKRSGATLIHISTDYIFGGEGKTPIREEESASPLSVYGRTKAEGEERIVASGCNYIIVRTSWLYSLYGKNFVKSILRLATERSELRVVNDQVGTPTYATDLAVVVKHLAEHKAGDVHEVYHFSNEGECSWYDFARAIVEASGAECKVEACSSAEYGATAKRPHYSVLDKSKIKRELGIEIRHWSESLSTCLAKMR